MARGRSAETDSWDWAALHRRCVREARRVGAPEAAAEDIAQDTLVRAWRHRARCRDPRRPLAWVLAICRNETWRRLAADRAVAPLEGAEEIAVDDDLLDETSTRVDVRRALSHLNSDDRTLLWLRYGLDLTQSEVAQALDIAEGTAKVRLHRLRASLRSTLE
jgi:RNA polymerase sigma-70 factor, ECF subfamily